MSKSHEHWAIAAAGNPAIWLAVLVLLLSTFTACGTPPWYKPYGFNSQKEVTTASSVPTLIKALGDNESEVRMNAAEALGRIGPEAKEAVPALIRALDDSDEEVRIAAAHAIAKVLIEASELVPILIGTLDNSNARVRKTAVEMLGDIGSEAKEAAPYLMKALGDSDYGVRGSAAEALGKMGAGAKEAVPTLVKALGDDHPFVRVNAAEALGKIGTEAKGTIPALIKALGDSDYGVRRVAIDMLQDMGPPAKEAVPELIKALGDAMYSVRWRAASALAAIGPCPNHLTPQLISLLNDADARVRIGAVQALESMGSEAEDAVPALIRAMGDQNDGVRKQAVEAIAKVGATAESVGPALTELLNDPDPDVRQEALSVLQQIKYTGDDFLETLEKIANKDPDYDMRKLASDTLRKTKFAILASGKSVEPKQPPAAAPPVSQTQRPAPPVGLTQRWAVVVGISEYEDTHISILRYASADARSLYEWLTSPQGGRYAPSRVNLLLDRDATARNIRGALFQWLGQALEEDIVTIYFAGHGSPQSPDHPENLFLLPYDTQYDNIASTGFPMWDIETALKRFIKAKRVVVIADACHAAGVGQSFDVARRAGRGMKVNPISAGLQNLSRVGEGVCVISASDEKQLSQEGRQWGGGHGVFTYFLLQGLEGQADYNKDTKITLGELIPYLSERVRRSTRNAQSPIVAGKFDPALSIGR